MASVSIFHSVIYNAICKFYNIIRPDRIKYGASGRWNIIVKYYRLLKIQLIRNISRTRGFWNYVSRVDKSRSRLYN